MNLGPKKPQPKCANCGKKRGHHKAGTFHCPLGTRHRVFGYTQFGSTTWKQK